MMTTALPGNPFPGMNPYLESPAFWPDAHNRIIVGLGNVLGPRLRPDYAVRIQQRVYVAEEPDTSGRRQVRIPDVMVLADGTVAPRREIEAAEPKPGDSAVAVALPSTELEKERYLEVLRVGSREVIAVIELLSPANKYGNGRREYLAKRAEVTVSMTHLVEIDLLQAGPPMPVIGDAPAGPYRILVSNARLSPKADLYTFGLRQRIPEFVMPLVKGSEGIALNLQPVVNDVYAVGSYDLDIDYNRDPEPPLSDADRAWLDQLLREQGLRRAEA